ncbi:endonuclease/exonuclease/phosphatase family protein [Chryseosolibacter indicus]|uniref:Endonuclease/exonuclease/phosphatase family protein n=1 Tax=Chryseosolibacter indicus TaxID=2782351 RepID=A0ABS5VT60_9BACT|nr:endonuclease/exonuclease/phosphatase family protein [Chryseosolibacter indicus]MBT1704623.1 endonuclease/exonuclease/phosphatase family protein [Chryseosolibacter indicus]
MISTFIPSFFLWLVTACSSAENQSPQPKNPPLNIMTYNIHHGNPPSREKGFIDLSAIAQTIRKSGAHLVALQELDSVTIRSGKTFQLKILADMLGMHYYFGKAISYEGGAYGVGILSKYPITQASTTLLPKTEGFKGEDRALALVKVTLPGNRQVYFGSTHLDVSLEENRLLQCSEIVSVAEHLDAPVIVGGDFNSTDEKAPMQELLKYFNDASTLKAPTIPVVKPTRRIDYIVYSHKDDFEVLKEEVMTDDNYGSDHLAFWVRLRY